MLAVAVPFVSMAISGKPGLEVGEPPGGGEEVEVASMAISGEPGPEVGEPPGGGEEDVVSMTISGESEPGGGRLETALCVQFCPQQQPLLAPGARWRLFDVVWFVSLRSVSNRIAQEQQSRPCFAVSLEEDEEQTQEGRRRGKLSATPSHCA